MGAALKSSATHDDILALPEAMTGQILGGELFASPRPTIDHSLTASVLGGELSGPLHRGRGGQWLLVSAHSSEDRVRAEPFVEIEIDLSALWIA